jgi:photosystem II stability/assembly factor-like uncharacterized protein
LVIGINHYKYVHTLATPINDAKAIAQLLHGLYGFQTELLLDADHDQILTALVKYRKTLPENSNLLIYFAGHGVHDADADAAYWLPVDAQSDNNVKWISADDITRDVKAMPALHVLIISDSCYSGYLAAQRSVDAGINPEARHALMAKMLSSKSRNLMSSGGDEPVADSGAPGHSVFAASILDSLRRIDDDTFTASDLFYKFIQPEVGGRSDQVPQYNVIRNSGHLYGDFVFSRQPTAVASAPATTPVPPAAVTTKAPAATAPVRTASRTTDMTAAGRSPHPPENVSAWAVGGHGTILHTDDGGSTWQPQNSGTTVGFLSITFATPQLGWVAGEHGTILHTDDGGLTWKPQTSGTSQLIRSVAFATPQSGWAVGDNGTFLHTDDGGRIWKPQDSGTTADFFSITFVTPQLGWAAGYVSTGAYNPIGLILHTVDGGRTWKRQNNIPYPTYIAFANPQSGWVIGDVNEIVHTDDGGRTWKRQDSGTGGDTLNSIAFATPQSGWIVGGSARILHTDDGGDHWINQSKSSQTSRVFSSVAFATPQSGWIVGRSGTILHTDDGGRTWNSQNSGTSENLESIALAPSP